jgi:hypothetical protein
MASVRSWTLLRGFEYHFVDDRLFEYAPTWYRERVQHSILLVSDLARLIVAKELLTEYDRAIWIDADFLIFEPSKLLVEQTQGYAFCRELWLEMDSKNQLGGGHRVNNAMSLFVRGNAILDFAIDACQSIVRQKTNHYKLDVGTNFLTNLHAIVGFPLLDHVAMISPYLLINLVREISIPVRGYRKSFGSPMYAANLCSSFRKQTVNGMKMSDELFEQGVEVLLREGSVGREWLCGESDSRVG